MVVPLGILVSLLLVLPTTISFHVHQGCVVRDKWVTSFTGPRLNITFWQPPTPDTELVLQVEDSTEVYNLLFIRPSEIVFEIHRNFDKVRSKSRTLEFPLAVGWTELWVEYGARVQVTMPGYEGVLLDVENDLMAKKVVIAGSNFTLNCHDGVRLWLVEEGHRQVVPVNGSGLHLFSLYTRTVSHPIVTVGHQHLALAWNGRMVVSAGNEEQLPLPPHTQHNFTLMCSGTNCNLETNVGAVEWPPLECLREACYLTFSGRSSDSFMVLLEREDHTKLTQITDSADTDASGQGMWIIIAVVVVVVAMSGAYYALHFMKREKHNQKLDEESLALLYTNKRDKSVALKQSKIDAVRTNELERLKFLLEQEDEDPFDIAAPASFEAHLQGNKDVVSHILKKHKKEHTRLPDDLVKEVTKGLSKRMKQVFSAATKGKYRGSQGIHIKLKFNNLPGTIMDLRGRTILHHIALAECHDGSPAWRKEDIEDFIKEHKPYPNAVDFEGQTVLHLLAGHPRNEQQVVWGGQSTTVKDAWLELIKLMVNNGCDPRIKVQGQTAEDISRDKGNTEQADVFKQYCLRQVQTNRDFPALVNASKEGNTEKMTSLLIGNTPVLPLYAEEDPLDKALRCKQRNAVFLLLSAGAPTCSRHASDHLTALEVACNSVNQPALFPALIRKVIGDNLKVEEEKVSGQLKEFIKKTRKKITLESSTPAVHGDVLKSKELRKMLIIAAKEGLSLTCQILGLEDISFNHLLGEKKLLDEAAKSDHQHTVYTLCRDLHMMPYTCKEREEKLEWILSELRQRDLAILKKVCKDRERDYGKDTTDQIYKQAEEGYNTSKDETVDSKIIDLVLYWAAEYGLLSIIVDRESEKNRDVQKFSRTRMLHVAAASGRTEVLEYLLYMDRKEINAKTIRGFTAHEIAAMRAEKDCLMYLQDCFPDMTKKECEELENKYKIENVEPQFEQYSHEDAVAALSESAYEDQAYRMLKMKGEKMKINSFRDLKNLADESFNQITLENMMAEAQTKINLIENKLKSLDPIYRGTLKIFGPLKVGYDVTSYDIIHMTLELNDLDIEVDQEGEDIKIVSDKYTNGSTFKKSFLEEMEKVVSDVDCCEKLSLVPPFMTPSESGVYLHWLWEQPNSKVRFLKINIIPVLKVRTPLTFKNDIFNKRQIKDPEPHVFLLLATPLPDWLIFPSSLITSLMESLTPEEKKALYMCRFITQLISSHWASQRYLAQFNSSKIPPLRTRALEDLCIRELSETTPGDFRPETCYKRVMSILRRATEQDGEAVKIKEHMTMIYNANQKYDIAPSICGIIKYLEELGVADNTDNRSHFYTVDTSDRVSEKNNSSDTGNIRKSLSDTQDPNGSHSPTINSGDKLEEKNNLSDTGCIRSSLLDTQDPNGNHSPTIGSD